MKQLKIWQWFRFIYFCCFFYMRNWSKEDLLQELEFVVSDYLHFAFELCGRLLGGRAFVSSSLSWDTRRTKNIGQLFHSGRWLWVCTNSLLLFLFKSFSSLTVLLIRTITHNLLCMQIHPISWPIEKSILSQISTLISERPVFSRQQLYIQHFIFSRPIPATVGHRGEKWLILL